METRTCLGCGETMNLYREGAKTCSPKCRKRASRVSKAAPFPAEMVNKDRWIRRTATKRPVTVAGHSASSTNSATWSSYSDASKSTAGVSMGFVLGSGVGCIDLDHCITDGVVADWAQEVLDASPETFIEVSQSGTGLHIFGLLPEMPGRNIRRHGSAVEFYSTGRYIAVTGKRFGNAPLVLADLSEVVAALQ